MNEKQPGTRERESAALGGRGTLYGLIVALGVLLLLLVVVVGALAQNRTLTASLKDFRDLQFTLFAQSSKEALRSRGEPQSGSVPKSIPPELTERVEEARARLLGAAILWVDDGGAFANGWERRALSTLGISIDYVTTTADALALLQQPGFGYDMIITDLNRENGDPVAPCYPGSSRFETAGCDFIQRAKAICGAALPATMIYALNIDSSAGHPANTTVATSRFDVLIEQILDTVKDRHVSSDGSAINAVQPCGTTMQ